LSLGKSGVYSYMRLTPLVARLMARVDVNQTIVRQRAEIIAHMETGGGLMWEDIEKYKSLGLEAHRTALKRYSRMVDEDAIRLRAMGFQTPRYAMPGVVVTTSGIKVTLSFLRNNDAHLWDDFITARRKILMEA